MNITTIYEIAMSVIATAFFVKSIQKHRLAKRWETACYQLRFEEFKRRAKDIKTIQSAANLQREYRELVSATFYLSHSISGKIREVIIKKITETNDPDKISLIIGGDLYILKDIKTCEGKIWSSVEFEVRSHLKKTYQINTEAFWLKVLVG